MSAKDALLLVGHGSARYPDAGNVLQRHAASLRAGDDFSAIEIGLLNGAPTVADAIGRIDAPLIRVVPFFMEDGYFSRVAVPRTVAAAMANESRRAVFGPPIGIHPAMPDIIEQQAQAGCHELGVSPHHAAVVVVGHGSSTAPGRALALHAHVAKTKALVRFARMEAACLEEAPFLADTLASLRAHPVIVLGFFANRGGHIRDDVPSLIEKEQTARGNAGPEVHFHRSVTDDRAMTRVILDQAIHAIQRHGSGV